MLGRVMVSLSVRQLAEGPTGLQVGAHMLEGAVVPGAALPQLGVAGASLVEPTGYSAIWESLGSLTS